LGINSEAEVVKTKPGNGLANWRKRMVADKERRMIELAHLREGAIITIIDGQEFRILTIPDNYAWKRPVL